MAGRLYLMPTTGSGTSSHDPIVPKYASTFAAFDSGAMYYGLEPACIVWVNNIDAATRTALTANADVVALPNNLDSQIGAGNLTAVKNAIEGLNIPANWVVATDTYRQTVRSVSNLFLYLQRLQGLGTSRLLTGGVTLASTFGSLPQSVQDDMIAAAQSFGFDTSQVTASTTLRVIFKVMLDQFGNVPVVLGDFSL
jgi:hypothetical protein